MYHIDRQWTWWRYVIFNADYNIIWNTVWLSGKVKTAI